MLVTLAHFVAPIVLLYLLLVAEGAVGLIPPTQPFPINAVPAKPPPRNAASDAWSLPQFYMNFGKCGHDLQQQEFGRWNMTRPLSAQVGPQSLILRLDTKDVFPVAPGFGKVEPPVFMIRQMHLAYFTKSGVAAWYPVLDKTPYRETPSAYTIRVNRGKPSFTVRDLKDTGVVTRQTFVYSLKVVLNGAITPSTSPYEVEVIKTCALKPGWAQDGNCTRVPDPASVFVSQQGYFAYSFWNVGQPLTVDGVYTKDHAWCPVQTGVTTED